MILNTNQENIPKSGGTRIPPVFVLPAQDNQSFVIHSRSRMSERAKRGELPDAVVVETEESARWQVNASFILLCLFISSVFRAVTSPRSQPQLLFFTGLEKLKHLHAHTLICHPSVILVTAILQLSRTTVWTKRVLTFGVTASFHSWWRFPELPSWSETSNAKKKQNYANNPSQLDDVCSYRCS